MHQGEDKAYINHRRSRLRRWHALLSLALLLSACGTFEMGLVPTPTATPSSSRYENAEYGFAFTYPSVWTVSEAPHVVWLRNGTLVVRIGYKRIDEAEDIAEVLNAPTDGTVTMQKLLFLGKAMPADAVVYARKIKAILYHPQRPVTAEDLVFSISLRDAAGEANAATYEEVDITDATMEEVKAILESFERSANVAPAAAPPVATSATPTATPPPGWARYISAEYGFAFYYPVAWELAQVGGGERTVGGLIADAVHLSREDVTLVIRYRRPGQNTFLGAEDDIDDLQERGLVPFLDTALVKRVFVSQDVDKQVFLRYAGRTLDVFVLLRQSPTSQMPQEIFALSAAIQAELDGILQSFVLTDTPE